MWRNQFVVVPGIAGLIQNELTKIYHQPFIVDAANK